MTDSRPQFALGTAGLVAAAPDLLAAVRESLIVLAQIHIADPNRRDKLAQMIASHTALLDRVERAAGSRNE